MFLQEYQSKQYFKRYGIPVPEGEIATSVQQAASIAASFAVPVVINAQSLSSKRVFRVAHTAQEAEHIARDILAMTISGVRVRTLLIEPLIETEAEYFLGIYGNRSSDLLMFASSEGGNDISVVERTKPDALFRETINPFLGVHDFQARNLASGINLPREAWNDFTRIAANLYRCTVACDAVRAEINPLGYTKNGELIALGGRLVIDDNALFRQAELAALRDEQAEQESVVKARSSGITYIRLNGRVGCIVSGAGLGMATIDLLAKHNAPASSFLDLGSDITQDKIRAALQLIEADSDAVLFNIFADRAPCEQVAHELVAVLADTKPSFPFVVRLVGDEPERGEAILNAPALPNLATASSTTDAVRRIAAAVKV
jgi:succinyl-CoA synthetase beta subunit